ncbi:hypothetical protein [Crossiella cryophila]|uniref:Uncharacterized protein n=1 Tax=Crossiella cryophila TaxID=43355 RepID=A0A7W7CKV5_9PSEU|nr:hypothetical protein [Crossiella cryophila]MBB4681334.1 hypothetical protein [Crossiella cryophila]
MRRTLLTLLACLALTGCAQPAEPAASAPASSTPAAPPATTTPGLPPEQERAFRHLTFQAVLPIDTVQSSGTRFHEQHVDKGPMTSCWAELSTPPAVSYLRRWQSDHDWASSAGHLYQGRRAEQLIAELRELATRTCPAWKDPELGSFQYRGEVTIKGTTGVDAAFAFCADNRQPTGEERLYCWAYLARNGPGTTMLSMVGTGGPKLELVDGGDAGLVEKMKFQTFILGSIAELTPLDLP